MDRAAETGHTVHRSTVRTMSQPTRRPRATSSGHSKPSVRKGTTDRRVAKTRRTLHAALVSLLHERTWDEVSVLDICERADIGRSTFYVHFADKEELLLVGFDELRKHLRAHLQQHASTPREPLQFLRGMIAHAHANQRLFRALVGKRSGQAVLQRFRELVVELVREDLAAFCPAGPERDVAVRFISGGLLELLTWSVESRSAPPPDSTEQLLLRMSAAAVRVLPR
jgi:AcrR family transcriptional regulator